METSETHQISHEEMRKCAGQYVAVMDGKVVASRKTFTKKIEELEKKHSDKKIIVTYISQKTYSSYNLEKARFSTRNNTPSHTEENI